ncbi:PAS domain S-box protein [Halogeometricum borinquense]|uniref:PAS domain S-box protein n=1 Tax=Halogeometricum borinquense TaxID=60847 RepID=UPI00341D527B
MDSTPLDPSLLEPALENFGAILWEWELETNTAVVHPSADGFFGREISSFDELEEIIHPADRERVVESLESSLETESPFNLEFRIRDDDEVRVIETRGSIHWMPETESTHVVGIATDITERKRRETEFQMIVEQSSDAITVVDDDGVIEYASPAVRHVFGYDPDEILGTNISSLIHPSDRDDALSALFDSGTTDEQSPEQVEYRLRHSDGSVRWVESRVSPQEDAISGGFVINTHDVTDRVSVEQDLKRTDESRSLALKASQAGIWNWEIGTNRVNWHTSCERVFGVPEGEFEGTYDAFARRVHDDDLPMVEAAINRTINEGEPYHIDYRIVRDDGVERWISARGKLLTDSSGTPVRLLGVVIDITEQKEREQELKQYERIVETASDPIYALDGTGQFVLVNEALAEALGCSKEELVGSNIVDRLEPADVEASLRHIMALARGESDVSPMELSLLTPDGMRDYEVNISLAGEGEEADAPRTVGVARDVTDIREHERRLSVLDRVLRHNIRNKLNIILAYSRSLMEYPDETVQSHADGIRDAGEALASISESARQFKASTHPTQSRLYTADIADCVNRVADEARLQFPHATIKVDQEAELQAEVHEAFELALTELVENGIKHSDHAEPTVEITVEKCESTVSVQVRDDGPGLDDMERDVILNGEETALEHGSGLGLWLVRWTIDNSGGTIDVRDNDPTGTVVEARIPLESSE